MQPQLQQWQKQKFSKKDREMKEDQEWKGQVKGEKSAKEKRT